MVKKQKIVFGIDEVGRGPLAGPVIACALTLKEGRPPSIWGRSALLRDSKQMTVKQREEIFEALQRSGGVVWGLSRVSEKVIDKINILQATKLAMTRAVKNLEKKLGKKADLLLIDGNFTIPIQRKQKAIIKGDEKEPLIALASIVAKVSRDKLMDKQHKKYPQYGFNKHKGYGTKQHYDAILTNGHCPLHRRSFRLR